MVTPRHGRDQLLNDLEVELLVLARYMQVLSGGFIERWAGREWELRQNRAEVFDALQEARKRGDPGEASLLIGQDAGLIRSVVPAAEVVRRVVEEAEEILSERLPALVRLSRSGERPAGAVGPGPGERPVAPE